MNIGVPGRGLGEGAAAPSRANPSFFGQTLNLNFSGRSQQPTWFCYLLHEKNGIHSVQRDEVPKIRDFY